MTLRTKFTASLALDRLCLQINNRVVQLDLSKDPFLDKAGQAVLKANRLADLLAKGVQTTKIQEELNQVLGGLLIKLLDHAYSVPQEGLQAWQISWLEAKQNQLAAMIREALAILEAVKELPYELEIQERPEKLKLAPTSPPPPSQVVAVAAEA